MIEFPLETDEDIEAYDESVRVTRAALSLPPAFEGMVTLRKPSTNSHMNDRMVHYWAEGIPELLPQPKRKKDFVQRCITELPRRFLVADLPYLNFPCPCGRVVWKLKADRQDAVASMVKLSLERMLASHGF